MVVKVVVKVVVVVMVLLLLVVVKDKIRATQPSLTPPPIPTTHIPPHSLQIIIKKNHNCNTYISQHNYLTIIAIPYHHHHHHPTLLHHSYTALLQPSQTTIYKKPPPQALYHRCPSKLVQIPDCSRHSWHTNSNQL